MLRDLIAAGAGYGTMAVLVTVGTLGYVAARHPGGIAAMRAELRAGNVTAASVPSTSYLVFNVVLSFLAAMAGGAFAARLARPTPNRALLVLAAVVTMMSVVSSRMPSAALQPRWYALATAAIGIAGVVSGAALVQLFLR